MNLIAITNPSDESAEAGFTHTQVGYITTESIILEYGEKIEDGAQIVIVSDGPAPRVWQFIAERVGDDIWIRTNNTIADYIDTEDVGPSVALGSVTSPEPEAELETFTVFGNNDDCEDFVAVVSATEDTVYDVGKQAGLVDEGYEDSVSIELIVKGNQSDLERVKV